MEAQWRWVDGGRSGRRAAVLAFEAFDILNSNFSAFVAIANRGTRRRNPKSDVLHNMRKPLLRSQPLCEAEAPECGRA